MSEPTSRADTPTLNGCVRQAVEKYLADLASFAPNNLYELLLREVERPLFETVIQHTGGNQTKASEILGINRGTLRKKLRLYGLYE